MGRSRRRGRILLAVAVVGLGLLGIGAAMEGTLVYASAPADVRSGVRERVQGTVVPGSLRSADGQASFELEGHGRRLPVRALTAPPGAFREGQGAVVEGTLRPDGVLVAESVIAQHGNTYRAAR